MSTSGRKYEENHKLKGDVQRITRLLKRVTEEWAG